MEEAVSDLPVQLTAEEMAELSALADGSLPPERRAEVEAQVAASPELQTLLERQRLAVRAMQTLGEEEVPRSLQANVDARRRALGERGRRGRRLLPRIALAGAAAVTVAVVLAVVLGGGPAGPTVADAARLATQPPTAPAPAPAGSAGTRLALGVQGVVFPDYARAYGWRALGVRRGRVDGRDATVVVYGKDGRRLGYVIVGGDALERPTEGRTTVVDGVEYEALRLNGRRAVTWHRGGHTCVLLGEATHAELLRLASWPLTRAR
jgi:anti-sigma factor RsiW